MYLLVFGWVLGMEPLRSDILLAKHGRKQFHLKRCQVTVTWECPMDELARRFSSIDHRLYT